MQHHSQISQSARRSDRADRGEPEFETFWLPEHWAVAFVNDDWTGVDDEEEQQIKQWLEAESDGRAMFYCVGCSEETAFMWRHDASSAGVLAADCLEYTFQTHH